MPQTNHKIIFGSADAMPEIGDETVQLIVTSPPYFNAPFDYKDLFPTYDDYLRLIGGFAEESFRVVEQGRIAVINTDDMLVDGVKYPIVADTIKLFQAEGFNYRDRLVWKKPDGYLRISRRSGVLLQNPYPMYFYPDNLLESILIFQKGKYDYKKKTKDEKEASRIDKETFQRDKWYSTLWEMTNVLPNSKLEKNIAAFPEELPLRVIRLFSHQGETVLDPFLGSGTTMKVAKALGRNSIGIEIKSELEKVILTKCGFNNGDQLFEGKATYEVCVREGENGNNGAN